MLIKIEFKDQPSLPLHAEIISLKQEFFAPIVQTRALFLSKDHKFLNTMLQLTNASPAVLLHFDSDQAFIGATFSLDLNKAPFTICSTASHFLLLPYPLSFSLSDVKSVNSFIQITEAI